MIIDFEGQKGIKMPGVNGEFPPFHFDLEATVQKYMSDRAWRREARAFYLNHFEHLSQEKIGKNPKVACAKSYVNDMIRSFRGELSRVAGEKCELWKADQLETAGLQVRRRGGIGQQDILNEHPEGMMYVYSCKALTIKRKISLPIEEMRPEVFEAQSSGRELILSVYNLDSGAEKEVRIDAKAPHEVVEIAPF